MKEIIGDDYPTYEESVNLSLAEQARIRTEEMDKNKSTYAYMTEVEYKIFKSETEKLKLENLQLKHRLACIESDIEIIARHITRYDSDKIFKLPSLNPDGSVYADEAWHNISNIEIACDLSDESVDEWGSDLAEEYRKKMMK
tara:strand:+ start:1103 stop:1528 length:426 start_codon:yes stop_codon:yes gene_type:complete